MSKNQISEPKQQRSIEKKRRIIEAGFKLFCEKGFYKTNTAEIAKEAGVSTGIVYRYFPDKKAIFLECLPDDPALSPDPVIRTANAARLKFYERYGATPILNTRYETPLKADDTDPPYLVFDNLGQDEALSRRDARRVVRAILERKYGDYCPPAYIKDVVTSIRDNPVRLRERRYVKAPQHQARPQTAPRPRRIAVVLNDRHQIHHVRETGYVEAPARVRVIRRELAKVDLFDDLRPRRYSEDWITAVHDPGLVDFIKRASAAVKPATPAPTIATCRFCVIPRGSLSFPPGLCLGIRLGLAILFLEVGLDLFLC